MVPALNVEDFRNFFVSYSTNHSIMRNFGCRNILIFQIINYSPLTASERSKDDPSPWEKVSTSRINRPYYLQRSANIRKLLVIGVKSYFFFNFSVRFSLCSRIKVACSNALYSLLSLVDRAFTVAILFLYLLLVIPFDIFSVTTSMTCNFIRRCAFSDTIFFSAPVALDSVRSLAGCLRCKMPLLYKVVPELFYFCDEFFVIVCFIGIHFVNFMHFICQFLFFKDTTIFPLSGLLSSF